MSESDFSGEEEPMMEDSEEFVYHSESDYGGSDDGVGGYDYGVAGGSSPVEHLRKVRVLSLASKLSRVS